MGTGRPSSERTTTGLPTGHLEFTRLGGSKGLRLSIEPLCTYRDHYWLLRGEHTFGIEPIAGGVRILAR